MLPEKTRCEASTSAMENEYPIIKRLTDLGSHRHTLFQMAILRRRGQFPENLNSQRAPRMAATWPRNIQKSSRPSLLKQAEKNPLIVSLDPNLGMGIFRAQACSYANDKINQIQQ